MDNMKIMEPNQHSYYDDNLNSKIIMKQVNSPGLTLNYSGESTLTRKPKMHFLVNGGSLPRSMTLQSKEKVHPSNDFKTNVGQQMDETCQQLARLTSQSGSLHQPTSSATVTSSTATNKSGSKLTKTITSPCLRKLRSTLFPGSRDSRRAPILVNNTTELPSPNDQYNEDNQNNDDDIINPPLSARSISTPALNLQLATQPPEADYRPYPASNFSHSSTILHQQQHQMMPIMNSSMCNHYSGNVHYNNQSQQQFNDSYYLRDNYANYNNNNNGNSKYYTSNDNIGPDRSYLTATPVSCNYGYLPNQVYSNQQSRNLPQLHQQHQQQQPQHLIPKTNSNNQHQCLPARVDTNCSQLTNNNVDKIYNSPQTIGPQQQYHQQPVKVQSQHRFVEVCRPEELRQNDNYVSSSALNKNNDRKSASEQDLGSHIVVVSSYENNQTHGLTVKNSSASHNKISEDDSHLRHYHQPEASSPIDDECKTDNALNHMIVTSASSPDLAYKSSSDSGRGTRTSESGSAEVRDSASVSPPLDITSLDSDQTDSHRSDKQQQSNTNPSTVQSSAITLDKMQADLKKILEDDDELTSDGGGININTGLSLSSLKNQCSRLPVVHESDSWISDSSKTVDEPEKSSSKKIESNSAKKKDPPTTLSQQQSIKGSLTANRNLLMNGRSEISGNINKNGLLSKKLQPTEKSLPSKVNGNNSMTTDISSANNPITGQNKTPNKPKLGQTHLSNVKYGGIGKGLKLTTNKRWRHPLAEETGSVTTLGLESVDDVDDLTSEYTANTDAWENHENVHVRKQLSGLENMYSEILNLLGSRMHGAKKSMHHSSSGKLNRRLSGSVSSLSVASRDAFYSRNNKYLNRRDDFDSKGARRLKRLEGHVITLARSVSQLSSEIRSSQCLIEDVQTLRKDVDRIQEQLRCFKLTPLMDGGTLRRSTANNQSDPKDSTDKLRSEVTGKNNKLDKIKRFFGDEPPLRQFLKKLGYEKYASKFESEKIGLKELSALNEEKLIKLGIPMGPRVRILQELNKIHSPHSNIYLV